MAVKNHALDSKIIAAAQEEFLQKGFRDASLHRMVKQAGITTGALYTRYKNKDALFCSLVQDVLDEMKQDWEPMRQKYESVQNSRDPAQILQVIREEEAVYLDLLFRYHTSCVLLFCRSDGSSIGTMIQDRMEQKAAATVAYLKKSCSTERDDLDLDGIEILISGQFQCFRQILERGYSREKAAHCIQTMQCYMEAGWKALFEAILS